MWNFAFGELCQQMGNEANAKLEHGRQRQSYSVLHCLFQPNPRAGLDRRLLATLLRGISTRPSLFAR